MLLVLFACSDDCLDCKDTSDSADTADSQETGDTEDTAVTGCRVTDPVVAPLGDPVNHRALSFDLEESAALSMDCVLTSGQPPSVALFGNGSTWRYWDGATVDADWAERTYDDGAWPSGAAPLGYGDPVATEIGYGGDSENKHVTAWFRTSFSVADAAAVPPLRLIATVDDGARAFLNGTEIGRTNLPSGAIDASTYATDTVDSAAWEVTIDPSLVVTGENVVAVEVHQADKASSDLGWDAAVASATTPAPDPDEVFHFERDAADHFEFELRGLLADATYTCTVTPTCGSPQKVTVETDPLPADIPAFVTTGTMPHDGYVLFNTQRACADDYSMDFVMIDPGGRARWYARADGIDLDGSTDIVATWIPDGRILWGGGTEPDGVPHLIDLDGNLLYQADYAGIADDTYHHEVAWTTDGTILGLVEEGLKTDGGWVAGFAVVEIDPMTDEVIWRWSSQEGYDAGGLVVSGGGDPFHVNALAQVEDADGTGLYLSFWGSGDIVRVDKTTGEVSWYLGLGDDFTLLDAEGEPADPDDWFTKTHSVSVPTAGRLLVYDNGTEEQGSRVLQYAYDPAARTAQLVWAWDDGFYNTNWGGAERLPGGEVLIDQPGLWCINDIDQAGSFIIVGDDEVERWRATFEDRDESSYRAQWIDACALSTNQKYCP